MHRFLINASLWWPFHLCRVETCAPHPVLFVLLNFQKTGKAVLALQRMANLSCRPDSPGSSSEGKTDKKRNTHPHIQTHTMPSYVLQLHAYGRWLAVSDCHFKFTLLWSVKPRFRFIHRHPPSHPEPGWSQEAEEAIQSLDEQLQSEPRFQQALKDASLPKGATLRLTCLVSGSDRTVLFFIKPHNGL